MPKKIKLSGKKLQKANEIDLNLRISAEIFKGSYNCSEISYMAGCSKQYIRRIEIEAMRKLAPILKEVFKAESIQSYEAFEILRLRTDPDDCHPPPLPSLIHQKY